LALPGRDDVKARYFPSGLKRGDVSLSVLDVICRSFVPSTPIVQMCPLPALSSLTSIC